MTRFISEAGFGAARSEHPARGGQPGARRHRPRRIEAPRPRASLCPGRDHAPPVRGSPVRCRPGPVAAGSRQRAGIAEKYPAPWVLTRSISQVGGSGSCMYVGGWSCALQLDASHTFKYQTSHRHKPCRPDSLTARTHARTHIRPIRTSTQGTPRFIISLSRLARGLLLFLVVGRTRAASPPGPSSNCTVCFRPAPDR